MIINLFFALSLSICCNHSIQMKANNNEQKCVFLGAHEKFNFSTDSFVLEGKTYDSGPWILIDNLPLYLITTHRDRPDRYHKLFNDGYISVRITLTTSAVGDRNKGRVTFRDIMAFGNYYAS